MLRNMGVACRGSGDPSIRQWEVTLFQQLASTNTRLRWKYVSKTLGTKSTEKQLKLAWLWLLAEIILKKVATRHSWCMCYCVTSFFICCYIGCAWFVEFFLSRLFNIVQNIYLFHSLLPCQTLETWCYNECRVWEEVWSSRPILKLKLCWSLLFPGKRWIWKLEMELLLEIRDLYQCVTQCLTLLFHVFLHCCWLENLPQLIRLIYTYPFLFPPISRLERHTVLLNLVSCIHLCCSPMSSSDQSAVPWRTKCRCVTWLSHCTAATGCQFTSEIFKTTFRSCCWTS